MLEVKLGRLKHDTGYHVAAELQAVCATEAYGYAELSLAGPLVFSGQAENVDGEIRVYGRLTAPIALVCSRCGQTFPQELVLPFDEIYSGQAITPDTEGEQDKHQFSGDSIDITPEALRLLFPELPMKPLCSEDCQGLCPICGADLNREPCNCSQENIDPRWEALRALLDKNEK